MPSILKSRVAQSAACLLFGVLIGWWWAHPRPQPVEGEAIARVLPKSGAVVLERDPAAPVSKLIKQAIKESGGKAERVVHLTVQPRPVQESPESAQVGSDVHTSDHVPDAGKMVCSCEPVAVDLALVRMPDDSRRVLALADGAEIAGIDIPFTLPAQRAAPKWAAGVSYSTWKEPGAWIDRAVGPFTVGVAIEARSGGLTGTARVGIRW